MVERHNKLELVKWLQEVVGERETRRYEPTLEENDSILDRIANNQKANSPTIIIRRSGSVQWQEEENEYKQVYAGTQLEQSQDDKTEQRSGCFHCATQLHVVDQAPKRISVIYLTT